MRLSVQGIQEKRKNKENVIFMTGITSFLGSFIASELLNRGHRLIFLCRSNKDLSAMERVAQVLTWMDIDAPGRVEVVEGNIDKPQFGLSDSDYSRLKGSVDEIIHCVAESSFKAEDRERVEQVNKQGTLNMLTLAKDSPCYFFHHVSTAYVAGAREGVCEEKLLQQDSFHNYYEQSKYEAEYSVKELCDGNGIRFKIFRPSIVCGDAKTGRSLKFNALYYPIKVLYYLRKQFEEDFLKNDGAYAKKMGVKKLDNGKMYLPLRLLKDDTIMNYVTIDYVVHSTLAIMEGCLESGIHHITNDKPISLDDLVKYTRRYLNIEGFECVEPDRYHDGPRNPIEKLWDGYTKPYDPYMHDRRHFDNANSSRLLKNRNISPQKIDYQTFATLMDFAVKVNWGKAVFKSPN